MGNKEYYFSSTSQENTETKSLCSRFSSPPKRLDLMSCVSAEPCEDLASFPCTLTRGSAALWEEDHTRINNDASVFS